MSLQFVDKVRFELNEIDSMFNSIELNAKQPATNSSPSATNTTESSTVNHSNMFRNKLKQNCQTIAKNTPKIPSNLVKSTIPSFATNTSDVMIYDRKQLMDFLAERQDNLVKTRSEYEVQFENFFSLAKKFHLEKLNNLKLTFKNQILKQQIYFETELLDLCKEYNRDYECAIKTKSNTKTRRLPQQQSPKLEQEKHLVRQFKTDMKKLLDYMRESLINSSDTLIEAYETCQTLKGLEHAEANFQKQNNQMKSTTTALIQSLERTNLLNQTSEESDEDSTDLDKQLNDEQLQFNKYKQEMDELMHTLDDIELQHLHRKDQLSNKTKFCNKLKSKFKFIESKYDVLNKQITNLKYESYVYKELWTEKKRTNLKSLGSFNDSYLLTSNQKNLDNENSYCEFNSCSKSSAVSSLSPSSLSKSSSTSSLSDCCAADMISSSNDTNSNHNAEDASTSSTTSSSSSSLCNQDLSEILTGSTQLDYETNDDLYDQNKEDNRTYLSLTDYNRKLSLINELINLHKSKMSTKDLWSMSSSNSTADSTNFIKANIKCFDLKEEEKFNTDLFNNVTNYTIFDDYQYITTSDTNTQLETTSIRLKQASSLDLTDCSTDGDRVIVENCNLKSDRDISNWYITRQIENMSISKYQLPIGSVIKSGKVLKIETPFANDQLDYLIAIKNQYKIEQQQQQTLQTSAKFQFKKLCLKIRTKLISPDGTLKAIHIQEIPQFYSNVFKYANMIQFL